MTLVRRTILATVLALSAGCALEKLTAVLEPETGSGLVYSLIAFNGRPLPANVVSGQTTLEIRKGALTLGTDSTWIVSYVIRQTNGGGEQNSVQTSRGQYSLRGTNLSLRLAGDTVTRLTGPYSTTDVTLTDVSVAGGDQMVFRR